jgi:hypothetical protein
MSPVPAQVGFARRDLAPALPDGRDFAAARVEAVAMFVGAPDGTPESIWLTFDFMDFDLQMVNAVKAGVEASTGIPQARAVLAQLRRCRVAVPSEVQVVSLNMQQDPASEEFPWVEWPFEAAGEAAIDILRSPEAPMPATTWRGILHEPQGGSQGVETSSLGF